jgi:putative transposase
LLSADADQVRFHYRDRVHGNQVKVATLPADEFLRRFLLHVLPKRLQRIRHYGLLASRNKETLLARCRELLGADPRQPPEKKSTADWLLLLLGIDVLRCPRCAQVLERTELPRPRGPATVLQMAAPEPAPRDTS